jgi:multifunctional beta-oxidation protein
MPKIVTFSDARSTHPTSPQEALQQIIANLQDSKDEGESAYADSEDAEAVAHAKKAAKETGEFSYTERDVILYNLGIGATEQELHWVFENDDHFSALPSFGVVPQFLTSSSLPMDFLPNFNPVRSTPGSRSVP